MQYSTVFSPFHLRDVAAFTHTSSPHIFYICGAWLPISKEGMASIADLLSP